MLAMRQGLGAGSGASGGGVPGVPPGSEGAVPIPSGPCPGAGVQAPRISVGVDTWHSLVRSVAEWGVHFKARVRGRGRAGAEGRRNGSRGGSFLGMGLGGQGQGQGQGQGKGVVF